MEIEKLRIHTCNIVEENAEKVAQLFSDRVVKCKEMLMGGRNTLINSNGNSIYYFHSFCTLLFYCDLIHLRRSAICKNYSCDVASTIICRS